MLRDENPDGTFEIVNDEQYDFTVKTIIGEAVDYHTKHPHKDAHFYIERFRPFWEQITNGYDALSTDALLIMMEQELPWIKKKDIITALKRDFSAVRQALAPCPEWQKERQPNYEDAITREQASAYWEYLLALEADINHEDASHASYETAGRAQSTATTSASNEVFMLDVGPELYEGVADLLKDYIVVPGVVGAAADRRLAHVIRFGQLPRECQGEKLVFCRRRGAMGDAYHFAQALFGYRGDPFKTFNKCFDTDSAGGVKASSRGTSEEPAVLRDETLRRLIRACRDAFTVTER